MERIEKHDEVDLLPEGQAAGVGHFETKIWPDRGTGWLDAKAIMSWDESTPTTAPRGTRAATSAVIFPSPHPMSRTRSAPARLSRASTSAAIASCSPDRRAYSAAFHSVMGYLQPVADAIQMFTAAPHERALRTSIAGWTRRASSRRPAAGCRCPRRGPRRTGVLAADGLLELFGLDMAAVEASGRRLRHSRMGVPVRCVAARCASRATLRGRNYGTRFRDIQLPGARACTAETGSVPFHTGVADKGDNICDIRPRQRSHSA